MMLSRRVAWLLILFGVWSWIIWPTFLRNIWRDPRSLDHGTHHGLTAFFAVHLVLTVVSLAAGTAIGLLGVAAVRRDRLAS